MRALKFTGIVIGAVVGLVIAAIALLLLFIDPNDYKPQLAAVVKEKTDMTLAIDDRLGWTLWPRIGVTLGKVSLSDAERKETLVAVGKAAVSVELMPLLSKQIRIDAVDLEGANVRFIQYADGTTSWDRMLAKLSSAPQEEKPSRSVDLNVKALDIRNSSVYLKDEKAGTERAVEGFAVSASDISLKEPFPLKVAFIYRQQDAAGKTLVADNHFETTVSVHQDQKLYQLFKMKFTSALSGTALPAPASVDLQGDVRADMAARKISVTGLALKADYKDKALKSQATVALAADVVADLAQTRLALDKLTVNASWPDPQRPAALTAALAGTVGTNWTTGELDVPQFAVNATVPGASYPKPLQVSLNAPFKGNWKDMQFTLPGFVLTAAGMKAEGNLAASLPALKSASASDAATGAAADAASTSRKAASAAGKSASLAKAGTKSAAGSDDANAAKRPVTEGMTLGGKLAIAPFNPRALAAALGITLPKTADAGVLKRASLDTVIDGNGKSLLLRNLRISLDDSTLTGEAGISDLKTFRQYARLGLDRMDADRYLPPSAPAGTPASPAPAPAAGKGGDVLPVELIRKQNLDVAITAASIKLLTYQVTNFRVAATATDGVVNVSDFKGSIFNGGFSAPLAINVQGAQPVLTLKPALNGMEIGPLARKVLKKDLLEGKASYNGALTLRGNSADAWMHSVSGTSDLKLENGLLHGVNAMKELVASLGKYQGLVSAVSGKDLSTVAEKQDDTYIASFSAINALDNGVVNTRLLNADLRRAKVAGSGSFNLVTQAVDYRFALNLDKSVLGDRYTAYALPVACKGNLGGKLATLCRLDAKAVQDMALKAAASKGLEKLGLQGATPKEAVQQKVGDEKAKAQEKAKEKLNQELNKGLQKLFGH